MCALPGMEEIMSNEDLILAGRFIYKLYSVDNYHITSRRIWDKDEYIHSTEMK